MGPPKVWAMHMAADLASAEGEPRPRAGHAGAGSPSIVVRKRDTRRRCEVNRDDRRAEQYVGAVQTETEGVSRSSRSRLTRR